MDFRANGEHTELVIQQQRGNAFLILRGGTGCLSRDYPMSGDIFVSPREKWRAGKKNARHSSAFGAPVH